MSTEYSARSMASSTPTMDTAEAAAMFGCSARTLYDLVARGQAPCEPLRLGRKIRWPRARVYAVLGLDVEETS